MEFYKQTIDKALSQLGSSADGLSGAAAQENAKKYGKNEIQDEKRDGILKVFLKQYADFLVIILIISAIISGILGDIESAVVIVVVITINAILGTVQHTKAQKSLDSLKAMSAPTAKVFRDGSLCVIPGRDVTVGDVVLIEAGDYICADGRIIENASLKVDESALTGESLPVEKEDTVYTDDMPIGDRKNMLFSGCFSVYGRAKMVVTSIGMSTEIGKIAALIKSTKEKQTPLQKSLDDFGKMLAVIILVVCAVVFGLSMLRGEEPVDAFVFAVALAVAAIPEALSSIVTIVLSSGTQKLAREHAVIRKLHAVEGLGSVSVICSDKTGTLTQNKMTIMDTYSDNPELLTALASLCSDATRETGDPTEIAIIEHSHKINECDSRDYYERISEVPFDSDRKMMSVVCRSGEGYLMITKGAVDVMMPLIKNPPKGITEKNDEFSNKGLRVLCVCKKVIDDTNIMAEDECDFEFVGLLAMQDPPREESKQAVAECKRAGIIPVMITGDHLVTASAIAREIGILTDGRRGVEGSEIEKLSDDELKDFVRDVAVYARVSPEHKIRIVRAWQANGCIVSMTGDGVNDAPALKQADIGVAMGITGSEVAKDAASMVLTDDNFATIVKAIENGRNIYKNIQRAIRFLLSGNASAIITVLYASVLALPVPFKAVHLLFINLLTDSLPAIALGVEPHSKDVMNEKPRDKNKSILTKDVLIGIAAEGLVIAAAVITAFYIGLKTDADTGATMAFATLCLSRLVHGFNCKSEKPIWFGRKLGNNKFMIGAFLIGFVLLNSVLLIPVLSDIFSVSPLETVQLLAIYALSFLCYPAIQLLKSVRQLIGK